MTVREALARAAARIGGATPRLDAEVLLGHVLGLDRGALLLDPDRSFDPQAFDHLVERRVAGEPVAYLTRTREFWSLEFLVTPAVLIPRPDSETVIEAALDAWRRFSAAEYPQVLDLGTGSGALLLSMLYELPQADGVGIDSSAAALAVARANASRLGLRADFRLGNWGQGLAERFDIILCNPPYVETGAALTPEVLWEPASALFAGPDGLNDYRRLIPQLPGLLAPDGVAAVEIGASQAAAVLALAKAAGLAGMVRHDLAGRDRCLVLRVAPGEDSA